jgi:hypothetical protein
MPALQLKGGQMQLPHPPDVLAKARKLIDGGWTANLATGSVTRHRDHRSGLVDDDVWHAMNHLHAQRGWVSTDPQPIAPSGSWEG